MFDTYQSTIPLKAHPESYSHPSVSSQDALEWVQAGEEGKLAVDVVETGHEVVVVATMAGTKAEDVSLHLQGDLLTIRGDRKFPVDGVVKDIFCQECFWGTFSRSIVLPVDINPESVQAEYRSGVLVIRFEKRKLDSSIPIVVIEE